MGSTLERQPRIDEALVRLLGLSPLEADEKDYDVARKYLWRAFLRKLPRAGYEPADFLQECISRALGALNTWRGEAALKSWFCGIAHNLLVDRFRERVHESLLEESAPHIEAQSDGSLEESLPAYPLWTHGASTPNGKDYRITLSRLFACVQTCGRPNVVAFLQARIDALQLARPGAQMDYVMKALGLTRKSEYNSLSQKLRETAIKFSDAVDLAFTADNNEEIEE